MSQCDEMAERLSAWLDGELEAEEIPSLMEHLRACPSCRRRKERFEMVNRLTAASAVGAGPRLQKKIETALAPKQRRKGARLFIRVAASIVVLIALALAFHLTTSEKVDAKRIVELIRSQETMNLQTLEDQDTALDTLACDLNVLKLDLENADLSGKESLALLERIKGLLGKVEGLRQNHDGERKAEGEKK